MSNTQTNLPALSGRAKRALDVLADGGRFVQQLERNGYTGREQWQYRLKTDRHGVVRGIGLRAFYELRDAGFLAQNFAMTTSVSSYYELRREG